MRPMLIAALVPLAACASGETAAPSLRGDPAGARQLLALTAESGPVPIEAMDLPSWLTPGRLASQAARGVRGLSVEFVPGEAPPGGPRLVMAFAAGGPPERLCAASATAGSGLELQAAFCEGPHAVAAASTGTAGLGPAGIERAVWRLTGRLFPDDYAETYGFELFGWRVRLGGEAAF